MPKREFSDEEIASMQLARIDRIVPGKLVYIEPTSTEHLGGEPVMPVAVKPDSVYIKRRREIAPYRGEPFAEIGLREGAEVKIVGKFNPNGANTVIVDPKGGRLLDRFTDVFKKPL